eukprot:CAMPEP_0119399904 /NCGR_PEP_ID=MMETSP1334-20130426/141597_1 /TAXON_ID=127549 /ORGANISM="Calcidiscus leptoporus, Strain RCC1130" /LENGTH=73 /DNA_ID=CAMNT_0007423803 /DNA_START=101 /DNA_END=322 /DNA_ORIENTATION=+
MHGTTTPAMLGGADALKLSAQTDSLPSTSASISQPPPSHPVAPVASRAARSIRGLVPAHQARRRRDSSTDPLI